MKAIAKAFWLLWQFPQTLLALLLLAILDIRAVKKTHEKTVYFFRNADWLSGVSLGEFIILHTHSIADEATVAHEYGHSVQSRIFGPLYLLIVGIPSAVFNNLWDQAFHKSLPFEKRAKWYYARYPEAWADRLGGVDRNG